MKKQFFVPGRTELAGNHTDHQDGRFLASAVDLGLYGEAEPGGSTVRIQSQGFEPFEAHFSNLPVRTSEFGTSKALVRGMLAEFKALGLNIGGFSAKITSTLISGSGLSSSAAFSVMIGQILNKLFNGGKVDPVVIARAAMTAENEYFGKPCGLMSPMTCALGHTIYMDLKTQEYERLDADFASMGLTLCLTDTGGSHAGLDTSYARIPADMVYIANFFDEGKLGYVDPAEFRKKGWANSNRPVRRATHFFDENERVPRMRDALKSGDGETYMRLMNESGRSSEKLLNNIVTSATGDTKLENGLELSAKLLEGRGAWRVHGGGFAGCVQALMPTDYFPFYKQEVEKVFGPGKCRPIKLI
ncbi:MAG: galactokinase [Candidatus Limivicinus sp.]|jgi:galactokinase